MSQLNCSFKLMSMFLWWAIHWCELFWRDKCTSSSVIKLLCHLGSTDFGIMLTNGQIAILASFHYSVWLTLYYLNLFLMDFKSSHYFFSKSGFNLKKLHKWTVNIISLLFFFFFFKHWKVIAVYFNECFSMQSWFLDHLQY